MAVHQLERENISSHVKANMNQLAKEGKLRSRSPFGYKFVGKDQDLQQKVVEKIKALHAEGLGYTKIAKKINDECQGQDSTLLCSDGQANSGRLWSD